MKRALCAALVGVVALSASGCSKANNPAYDNTAESILLAAGQAAKAFYAANTTYQGFNPQFAGQAMPEEHWTNGGEPGVGDMSIRGETANGVVIVTRSQSGKFFCIAETVSGETRGETDAKTPADCTGGGW